MKYTCGKVHKTHTQLSGFYKLDTLVTVLGQEIEQCQQGRASCSVPSGHHTVPFRRQLSRLVGNHFFSFLDSCILWVEILKHNSLVLSIFCFCMNSVSHGVCVHYKHFCCVCNRKWDFCICLSLALADNERDEYTYIHQSGLRAMMESVVLARIWRSKNAYVQLVRYPSQYLIFSSFFTWAILVCVSLIYLICSH